MESMQVSMINRQPVLDAGMTEQSLKSTERLIIQRILGQKQIMKGLGQWRILLDQELQCWICNNTGLILVFWSQDFGYHNSLESERKQSIQDQVEAINGKLVVQSPVFYSQQNNWKAVPMMTLHEFCFCLEQDKPDILQELQAKGTVRAEVKTKEELNAKELIKYELSMQEFYKEYYSTSGGIKKCLIKNLGFRCPQLINADIILEMDLPERSQQIYVIPMFMKPGKQIYVVQLPQGDSPSPNFYTHQIVARKRNEDPPVIVKTMKSNKVSRQFVKNNSVFKDWREDTPQQIQDCIEHDIKLWNVSRFVKLEEDLLAVENVMRKHGEILKNLFIQAASRGTFPYLGWADFSLFCQRAGIIDKKGAPMSTIDRVFIAVDQGDDSVQGYQQKFLMRYQFMEGLVRIANCKYKETGQVATVAEAVELLIQECLIEQYEWRPWQEFRDKELWTLSVQDLLYVNMTGIQKLTQMYAEPNKKHFKMQDCLRLFTKDTDCGLTEKDFQYVYGMSKMTVAKESQFHQSYQNVQFVEFLEMIGRAADVRYAETISFTLSQKIEFMLDSLFKFVGFKRLEVNFTVEEESASDEEY